MEYFYQIAITLLILVACSWFVSIPIVILNGCAIAAFFDPAKRSEHPPLWAFLVMLIAPVLQMIWIGIFTNAEQGTNSSWISYTLGIISLLSIIFAPGLAITLTIRDTPQPGRILAYAILIVVFSAITWAIGTEPETIAA